MDPVLPCQPCGWVAVLRPHAASAGHVTKATYSYLRGVYVRHGTKHVRAPRKRRTSENAVKRKFAVFHKSEVQLRRILIPRTWVNKGLASPGRRPMRRRRPVQVELRPASLSCLPGSRRGCGRRLDSRRNGRFTPLPGIPDNEYRTRDFNNAEVEVVKCWHPNNQCQGLYGSHEYSGRDVCPTVHPVVQHSGQENHNNRDRDEYCGSQQESWSKCKAVNVAFQVLLKQLRIHQTDDIAVEVA